MSPKDFNWEDFPEQMQRLCTTNLSLCCHIKEIEREECINFTFILAKEIAEHLVKTMKLQDVFSNYGENSI